MVQDFIKGFRYYIFALFDNFEIKAALSTIILFIVDNTGISIALYMLLSLAFVLDFIFGILEAKKLKKYSKYKLKKTFTKIFTCALCILLVTACDYAITQGYYHILAQLTISSIIITEVVSILDHCVVLELPVPSVVYTVTSVAKKNIDTKIHAFKNECTPDVNCVETINIDIEDGGYDDKKNNQ